MASIDLAARGLATAPITPNRTTFMGPGKNLFDKTKATPGKYIDPDNGNLATNAIYYASDYISVLPNTMYTRSFDSYMAFYTASKAFISGRIAGAGKSFTTPANCAYIRVSVVADSLNTFQVEKGAFETPFAPYEIVLLPQYAPISDLRSSKVVLPPKIYGVAGKEVNVYFDNIIIDDYEKYQWDVTCAARSRQEDERFTSTPQADGSFSLEIKNYRDYETAVGGGAATYVVKAPGVGAGQNRTVLTIGDSTTAAGVITGELLALAGADVMDLTLIGTQGTGLNKHEGRSGWWVSKFFTDAQSPFVFSGAFDFSQYMSTNGFTSVDRIIINLGVNDVFNLASDAAVNTWCTTSFGQLESMIDSMKAFSPSVVIGIVTCIPPSRHQDAFGANYGNGHPRWRQKRNTLIWNSNLIAQFQGREAEGIYIVPCNVALDTEHNMQRAAAAPWNSRTTETTQRQNNGVHPADSGYKQIADMQWYWLKSLEV